MTIVGPSPTAIFVNKANTIYNVNRENNEIIVWFNDSTKLTKIISGHFSNSSSIFVTIDGDIYIDNGQENGRVEKWISNTNTFVNVMNVSSSCDGIFLDVNDTLYCSMLSHHQVVKRWLNEIVMTSNVVTAGTGTPGDASNELNNPCGIFVDVNLDLYVADCGNNRVQLFRSGESNGTTVAGRGSSKATISLVCPSGIVLDGDKYLSLWIVEIIVLLGKTWLF